MSASTGRRTSHTAATIILIVGLPFLAGGLFMLSLAVHMPVASALTADWVETPARIQHVEVERSRSRSSKSTSLRLVATYTYTFEGKEYTGHRVGFQNFGDNVGHWYRDVATRIRERQKRGESVPCFVNPNNPAEALLDRTIRWDLFGMLLGGGLAFGLFGGAMLVSGVLGIREEKRKSALRQRYLDRPWLWTPQWHTSRIAPDKSGVFGAWMTALLSNCLIWPGGLILTRQAMREGETWTAIFLVFPLVGLGLLGYAVVKTLRTRRFGRSHLELDTLPGIVGGHLSGELVIAGNLTGCEQVEVTLKGLHSVTRRRSRSETETHQEAFWDRSATLDVPSGRFGKTEVRVPFSFQIPYDCRPCEDPDDDTVTWKLYAKAPLPGADLDLVFGVPVFRTEASDASIGEAPASASAGRSEDAVDAPPPAAKTRQETDAWANDVFIVSAWPGAGFGVPLLIAPIICFGAGIGLAMGVVEVKWFALQFVIGCFLVGPLLLLIGLSFLGWHRITIGQDEVTVERNFLVYTLRRTVPRQAITGAGIDEVGHSSSSTGESTTYCSVHLETDEGRKIKVGTMIRGQSAARWLAERLTGALGLPAGE